MKYKNTKLILVAVSRSSIPCQAANILNLSALYSEDTNLGTSYFSSDGGVFITGRAMIGQTGTVDAGVDDTSYDPTDRNASAVVDLAYLVWDHDKNDYKKGLGIQAASIPGLQESVVAGAMTTKR